jgi:DnaJ-class molecular chaperone
LHKYYSALGLELGADRESIKTAFRRLAMVFHPDRDPHGQQRFQEICQAYQVLMANPRATYNAGVSSTGYVNTRAVDMQRERRQQRGSRGERRFEVVLERDYIGTRIKEIA